MYIHRLIYPVTALGPGKRLGIWTAGCGKNCAGCANPELHIQRPEQEISVRKLLSCVNTILKNEVDGITISGGEPFDQSLELAEFLLSLERKPDVLIFSGYTLEEIKGNKDMLKLLNAADVLIDGRYIEKLNDGVSALRGSVNQKIHYLNPELEESYEKYLSEGRQIQNFIFDYRTVSVGIHKPPSG